MKKLTREDLLSLEDYSKQRNDFRKEVMEHKSNRRIEVGDHATLYFEDRFIMQYQIQEMLRAERIFESEGIQEELDTYNPMIPDGPNWKATLMIEFEDEDERKLALGKMLRIEDKVWMQVKGYDRVYAIADEDLERSTEEKTSSVHFLRFELEAGMISAAQSGASISIGIDHEHYQHKIDSIADNVRDSLVADLG